jgi:hypothetical protein
VRAEPAEEGKFQWLARFGFLVRGLLYIVIALLVIETGRTEDLTGAMEYLARGVGRWMLVLMVVGMGGYGAWRLCDAAFGSESGRHHPRAWRQRVSAGVSGAIHSFLAYKALRIAIGLPKGFGDSHRHVAEALHLPAGTLALAVAAAVLAGAGIVQLYKSASCIFLDELDDRARQPIAKWLGRVGYGARGIIFLTVGGLLARAALHHNAARAGGIEQALDALRGPLQFPIAAGLLLFGVYSILEARFRGIRRPPTEHIKRKVEETVAR